MSHSEDPLFSSIDDLFPEEKDCGSDSEIPKSPSRNQPQQHKPRILPQRSIHEAQIRRRPQMNNQEYDDQDGYDDQDDHDGYVDHDGYDDGYDDQDGPDDQAYYASPKKQKHKHKKTKIIMDIEESPLQIISQIAALLVIIFVLTFCMSTSFVKNFIHARFENISEMQFNCIIAGTVTIGSGIFVMLQKYDFI